jgi:YD repeat-containing protein
MTMTVAVPLIPRADLFGNPVQAQAQISPDGSYISWLAPLDGVMNLFVAPRGDLSRMRALTHEDIRPLPSYVWAKDSRHVLVFKDTAGDENWHIHAIDAETGETRNLTPYPGVQATLSRISEQHPGAVLLTHNRRDPKFPDLVRVDIASGTETLVAQNDGFGFFYSDDDFTTRLAGRTEPDGSVTILRPGTDASWSEWFHIQAADVWATNLTGIFSPDGKTTLMYDSRGRDTAALVRLDLETLATTELAADDHADISGVLTDRKTKAPLACAVNYDRVRYHALDPAIQPDLDFLAAADIGDWFIPSRTDDDALWVIIAHADTIPVAAYLYDRPARKLEKLYDARPALAGAPLARMRPEIIKSRDGLNLVCYLTVPEVPAGPHPLVLFVHGGPWGRDSFGYNAYHQWLANRGYAVLSVNFRSSTGFGKSFINAGDRQWGAAMDDDLLDAVGWAVAQGIADPARVAIMGGSYGGYAVLAGMTRNPQFYACGVDIVGPSNLETLLATIPPYWESIRAQFAKAIGDPDTEAGSALLRERSPVHRADAIARPLLIGHGANDPRVKQAESDQMVAAMKAHNIPVSYVLFPDEGHGFARPENNIAFLAIAEQFLAAHLGGRAEPLAPEDLARSTAQILEGNDQSS